MGEKWEKVLSKAIGVNGIHINSALLSAQNRKRIYWTNIGMQPGGLFGDLVSMIKQPKDKGILLKNILESEVNEKYFLKETSFIFDRIKTNHQFTPNIPNKNEKSNCLKIGGKGVDDLVKIDRQGNVKNHQDKASSLSVGGHGHGNHSDMDLIVHNTMPRSSTTGKGGTGHLSRTDGKTYCLDTGNTNAVEYKSNIRRLTPLECERLQTVKDNYTNHVSDSQRYKMLGNGWTVDVIAHIFSYLK
jgi:DNA (cytosine-5)-methyltransferase 3A